MSTIAVSQSELYPSHFNFSLNIDQHQEFVSDHSHLIFLPHCLIRLTQTTKLLLRLHRGSTNPLTPHPYPQTILF